MAKTFSYQNQLPVMSIPALDKTCQKLIDWSAPLLTTLEQHNTFNVINHFLSEGGEGELLQNALIKWQQQNNDSNWSAPVWKALYLESRDPLVINSNVFYYLKNKLDENNCSQANIASALIVSVYRFMLQIDKQTLTVDWQKEMPLCMNQYKNIFSSMRVPHQDKDEFKISSNRQHIVVMHKQRFYKINMLDESGDIRSIAEVDRDLSVILQDGNIGQNVGILTSMPRNDWAKTRFDLLELSENNKQAMELIEEAVFALCLDDNQPEELTEISTQLLYGDGKNRFFDKSLQLIVFNNGKTGINFEHTGVDGSVMLRLIAHIYDSIDIIYNESMTDNYIAGDANEASKAVQEVKFDLNNKLKESILHAKIAFELHTANTQTRVLNFTSFGKEQIKKFAVSPDAFVQVALQLAEYKLYGKLYSAYEAVMTRTFLDGRIDVLYTVSPESLAFIEKMQNDQCSKESQIEALIKATQKHSHRAKECRTGKGVYSHLLALKHHYKAVGTKIGLNKIPEIFTDKAFQALTNSVVCTSTTSSYGVALAGYGPIVDDGYGIRYFTRDNNICFNMTSRTVMQDKLDKMKTYIEQSLLEMADLMLKD